MKTKIILPDIEQELVDTYHESKKELDNAKINYHSKLKDAIYTLNNLKLSLRDIGLILDISHQRVHQILNEEINL